MIVVGDGLRRGIDLFNRGLYWEAHEAWESDWIVDRRGPDAGFYKGLIQVAAGCLHYRRHNRRGAVSKWGGGLAYLRPYLPAHQGLRLQALVDAVTGCLARMDAEDWPKLDLPVIEPAAR